VTDVGERHFVGIGGIGMSALARILLERGERVSGCDAQANPLLDELRALGAEIAAGHDASHVARAREVIVTAAIERAHPEIAAARARGVPVRTRGELLAEIAAGRETIAICGTHGKTTTTAMVHAIFRAAGADAGLALGGIDLVLGTNACDGSSPWFVTEADESDGSFALLTPMIGVLTNLEPDHVRSHDEYARMREAFATFFESRILDTVGTAVIGIDTPASATIAANLRHRTAVRAGLSEHADVRGTEIAFADFGSRFTLVVEGRTVGAVELSVPGAINVQNAVLAAAAAHAAGASFEAIAHGLRAFRGVHRRFEILARSPRAVVVDDYAHHPSAVRATIETARRYHDGPLVIAFEPHRYSRTAYFAREFAEALKGNDPVYLAPIYGAGEAPIPGISERSIGGALTAWGTPVRYVGDVHDLEERIAREAPHGALVLLMGAGAITHAAAALARRFAAEEALR
jgi:UDP-N-acetylmuramate--alanine ligase